MTTSNFAHPLDQDPNVRTIRRVTDLERETSRLARRPAGPPGPPGPTGPRGDKGTVWYSGTTVPSNAVGVVGDWYINTNLGYMYEKTDASVWTFRAIVKGDRGWTWRGRWTSGTSYAKDDVVRQNRSSWVALTANVGQQPNLAPAYWELVVSGPMWRGVWSASTSYEVTDVVERLGSSYIAVAEGTNHPPETNTPGRWELVASKGSQGPKGDTGPKGDQGIQGIQGVQGEQGLDWRGNWSSSAAYAVGDMVYSSERTYVATQPSINKQPNLNAAFWDESWRGWIARGTWSPAYAYVAGDVVDRLGSSYISRGNYGTNVPPESNTPGSWLLLSAKGDQGDTGDTGQRGSIWHAGLNDPPSPAIGVVGDWCLPTGTTGRTYEKTGATTWTARSVIKGPKGLNWRGNWSSSTSYAVDDAILAGNNRAYVCTVANTNQTPWVNPGSWSVLSRSLEHRGEWSASTVYLLGDVVERLGSSYVARGDYGSGIEPSSNPSSWSLVASKGDAGPQGAGHDIGDIKFCALAPSSGGTWLPCDGAGITSAMGYPLLRAGLISATYPYGMDGSGNPRIPDLRDRAIVGAGTTHTAGHAFGTETVTQAIPQMPVHSAYSAAGGGWRAAGIPDAGPVGGSVGSGNEMPNTQPSLAVPAYILANFYT